METSGSVGERNIFFLRQRQTFVVWVGDDEYDGDSKCHKQNADSVDHHALRD